MRFKCPISIKDGPFVPILRFCALTFLCIQSTVDAQNIGNWTFNNTLTGTAGLYNTVSVADFSAPVPIHAYNGGTEYFGENGWPAGAINTGMYLEFTLTPLPGYQLDISSIVLRLRRSNTGSPAGAGPNSWSLRSNLDGFAADIASGSMTYTYANYTVMPGPGFLQLYSAVTFRVYGYNTSVNPGGSSRLVADNITVTGLGYLLPVKEIVLSAFSSIDKITLTYKVYTAEKNSLYYIERSSDGIHFNTVFSNEENGDATEKKYTWIDRGIAATFLYYRVLTVNQAGEKLYSSVVKVKPGAGAQPFKSFVAGSYLYVSGDFPAATYKVQLYTINGQLLQECKTRATAGFNSFVIGLTNPLPSTVVVHLSNDSGYARSQLLCIPSE